MTSAWRCSRGREPIETFDRAIEAVRAFALSKTKSELLMRALDDKMLIAPIVNTAEVLALDQLSERDYWQRISLPGGPQLINARFSRRYCQNNGDRAA